MAAFGKYEVVEKIGEGGFGRVYKGWDPTLKRYVAIKTCSFEDPDLRRRFAQEAEIAASLRHPNIVTVHDFGESDGEPYLVQEFLEGDDLDVLIREHERPPLATQLSYLRQVAQGLRAAHESGVVHRDVKPANIRVEPGDRVKIMDFGIAKLMGAEQRLTRTGMQLGSDAYVSPEQLLGLEIDQRTDIFSFGVLAYELLTGGRPFAGETIPALHYQIEHVDPLPVNDIFPECPRELAMCVEGCLRKDRDGRFTDFSEVIKALDAAAGEDFAPTREPMAVERTMVVRRPATRSRWVRGSRRQYIGLLVAAAAVATFGIVNVFRAGTGAEPDRPTESATEQEVVGSPESPTQGEGPPAEAEATKPETTGKTIPAGAGATDVPTPRLPAQGEGPPAEAASGILVVIGGDPDMGEIAENVIFQELSKRGYQMVDRSGVDLNDLGTAGPDATRLQQQGIGVVVLGTLETEATPSLGRFFTGRAVLSLRTYDAGRLVSSATYQVGGGNVAGKMSGSALSAVSEAAEQVGHQAAAALSRDLRNQSRMP